MSLQWWWHWQEYKSSKGDVTGVGSLCEAAAAVQDLAVAAAGRPG